MMCSSMLIVRVFPDNNFWPTPLIPAIWNAQIAVSKIHTENREIDDGRSGSELWLPSRKFSVKT